MNSKSKMFRGSLDTIILKLLTEQNEMYGYEISKKVEEITKGDFKITEGALYPALHRLEAKGVLQTEHRKTKNRIRKYYSLTKSGNSTAQEMLSEMEQFIQSLQHILNPKLT